MATRAPSLSNSCAAASPIPLLPPVIRIFLSASLPIVVSPLEAAGADVRNVHGARKGRLGNGRQTCAHKKLSGARQRVRQIANTENVCRFAVALKDEGFHGALLFIRPDIPACRPRDGV